LGATKKLYNLFKYYNQKLQILFKNVLKIVKLQHGLDKKRGRLGLPIPGLNKHGEGGVICLQKPTNFTLREEQSEC
jgi:hypothetical protein